MKSDNKIFLHYCFMFVLGVLYLLGCGVLISNKVHGEISELCFFGALMGLVVLVILIAVRIKKLEFTKTTE